MASEAINLRVTFTAISSMPAGDTAVSRNSGGPRHSLRYVHLGWRDNRAVW